MAAFGYDFPLGMDFIMDSANAFQTKTFAMAFPVEREQATFNPQKGTAVYNYNLGALIFPGCGIKNADIYLKCIGPEDLGYPGVQCGEQGCDCLHITETSSVEAERTKHIEKGRLFDLKPGQMVDMQIPSPQKIDSNYRYDHVVVDLQLDTYESPENCFDEGYESGKFYFPIIDVSPPAEFVCQVQVASGRYYCPEVQQMFGGGVSAYLEDPFFSCHDDQTDSWVSCLTPGLFTKDDKIRVKVHLMTDGGKYCLKTRSSGVPQLEQEKPAEDLPVNLPGPTSFEIYGLGTVGDDFFAGSGTSMQLSTYQSAEGCSYPVLAAGSAVPSAAEQRSYTFRYEIFNNQYKVYVPLEVSVVSPGYSVNDQDRSLSLSGRATLTSMEVKEAVFQFQEGFRYRNMVGEPHGTKNTCVYQVATPLAYARNQRSVSVTAELLQPDASGSCFSASIPVRAPAFGRQQANVNILLQMEALATQETSKLHQDFKDNKCGDVLQRTNQLLGRKQNDIEDAIGIYYATACHIVTSGDNWKISSKANVCNLLDVFFNRHYPDDSYGELYPDDVKNLIDYKKIEKYMGEIQAVAGCEGVAAPVTSPSVPGTTTTIGTSDNKCDKSFYPIDYLTGDNAPWAFGCIDATHARSCTKATGVEAMPSFEITAGESELLKLCAGS